VPVPANRIADVDGQTLAQLKIAQEAITLLVFVPFAMLDVQQSMKLDPLWAALCLFAAVHFIFRG
jgi:hypothetical protein